MSETGIVSNNKVPGSMTQVGITMKYTFLDYFRTRRFFILLLITLLITALLTILVGYYRPQSFLASDLSFYGSWWGNSVTFVIILSGIFFGANVPYQFAESVLFALVYLAGVLGLTFFFSSLFKSSSMSIIVTAILFLFVFSLLQTLVANLVKIEPWFILTYGAGIIGNILTVPYPEHIHTETFGEGRISITTYSATIPEGLAILGLYFIVTVVLGLLLFERKEFT